MTSPLQPFFLCGISGTRRGLREPPCVHRLFHGVDGDRESPLFCGAGDLLPGRVARTEGHAHELPISLFLDAVAVKPGLLCFYGASAAGGVQMVAAM